MTHRCDPRSRRSCLAQGDRRTTFASWGGARLANPDERVLIWEAGAKGFAIFRGLTGAGGIVELFRIALDRAGGGQSDRFFRALVDHAFRDFDAKRLWLDANAENTRAVKVYTRAGFRLEGTLRGHWFRPALGRAVDLQLMGLMRHEWESLEPLPARA